MSAIRRMVAIFFTFSICTTATCIFPRRWRRRYQITVVNTVKKKHSITFRQQTGFDSGVSARIDRSKKRVPNNDVTVMNCECPMRMCTYTVTLTLTLTYYCNINVLVRLSEKLYAAPGFQRHTLSWHSDFQRRQLDSKRQSIKTRYTTAHPSSAPSLIFSSSLALPEIKTTDLKLRKYVVWQEHIWHSLWATKISLNPMPSQYCEKSGFHKIKLRGCHRMLIQNCDYNDFIKPMLLKRATSNSHSRLNLQLIYTLGINRRAGNKRI